MKRNKPKPVPQHIRRQKTEASILATAEALFVKNGFHRTTLDEIASSAGLTKGAIYVHFKDKQDLLLVLLERAESQVISPILNALSNANATAEEKLNDYLSAWSLAAVEKRESMFLPILMSFEFLGTGNDVEQKISSIYERHYKALGAAITDAEYQDSALPMRERAAVIIGYMEGLLLEWLRRGHTLNGEIMTDIARHMMLQGILTSGEKPLHSLSPAGEAQ